MENTQGSINLRELFPWLRFFRAFRIAIDPKILVLATLGLVALSVGNAFFSMLPFAPNQQPKGVKTSAAELVPDVHPVVPPTAWNATIAELQQQFGRTTPLQRVSQMWDKPWSTLLEIFRDGGLVLLQPVRCVVDPAVVLFRTDHTWADLAYAWTRLLWAICVWAFFGGAIARLAATKFAIDEPLSLRESLRFSAEYFQSYVGAALVPAVGAAFFWICCVIGGLFGRIPIVGEWLVGVLWFLPLLAGLLIALLVVPLAVGWPVMVAAISTEGSDAFDGMSRAYSYIFSRPWYYLFLTALLLVYGAAAVFIVWLFAQLTAYLSGWSVAPGIGLARIRYLFVEAPALFGGSEMFVGADKLAFPSGMTVAGVVLVGAWLRALALATVGFVFAFFWTAVTVAYFLLRKSDDGTDFDEVYMPQKEESTTTFEPPKPETSTETSAETVSTGSESTTSTTSEAEQQPTEAQQQSTETAEEDKPGQSAEQAAEATESSETAESGETSDDKTDEQTTEPADQQPGETGEAAPQEPKQSSEQSESDESNKADQS